MGFSELTIAGLLGHSVPGVTARYAHVPDTALVAAADRVASRIAMALDGKSTSKVVNLRTGSDMPMTSPPRLALSAGSAAAGRAQLAPAEVRMAEDLVMRALRPRGLSYYSPEERLVFAILVAHMRLQQRARGKKSKGAAKELNTAGITLMPYCVTLLKNDTGKTRTRSQQS
jgi:hypothetical protein